MAKKTNFIVKEVFTTDDIQERIRNTNDIIFKIIKEELERTYQDKYSKKS